LPSLKGIVDKIEAAKKKIETSDFKEICLMRLESYKNRLKKKCVLLIDYREIRYKTLAALGVFIARKIL